MTALQAKRVRGALKKAQNVGRAEESVTIDGCTIVLQSMPSSSYDAILKETEDLEGSEYLHEYQNGYLCRAIVEIEGVDLRNVDFIEDEVPDGSYTLSASVHTESKAQKARDELSKLGIDLVIVPPDGSESERKVLVERHEWLRKIIRTWSQEAVAVAWRKYADVVVSGEARAKDRVEFKTPDETPEDKFRRLLSEAKNLETELPVDMLNAVLAEFGYFQKTSTAELDQANQRLKAVAQTQIGPSPEPLQDKVLETPREEPQVEAIETPRSVPPILTAEDLAQRVKSRVPLNRVVVDAPTPQSAGIRPNSRTAQIAEVEGLDLSDPSLVEGPIDRNMIEVAEVSKRVPIDGKEARRIIDAPPAVGINPRFSPRHG